MFKIVEEEITLESFFQESIGNIILGGGFCVGANAVVLKDVPPKTTVVGVPGFIK